MMRADSEELYMYYDVVYWKAHVAAILGTWKSTEGARG